MRRIGVLAIVLAVAACAGGDGGRRPGATPVASDTIGTPGPAVAEARAAIAEALGARSVQLQDPQVPYRPAEAPELAGLPRAVYQAILPEDPGHGYIVVYDLPDAASAAGAAEAQARYVGSPVGRVQFPTGTQFVVRRLGSSVVFYAGPPDSPDDQAPDVVAALRTVGSEVTVPS